MRNDALPDGLVYALRQDAPGHQLIFRGVRPAVQDAPHVSVAHAWKLSQLPGGGGVQIQGICFVRNNLCLGAETRCREGGPQPGTEHTRLEARRGREHKPSGKHGHSASHELT